MAQINSTSELLNAFRRHAVMIFGLTVLGVAASLLFALSKNKIYEATAVVQIETPQIAVDPGSIGSQAPRASSENLLALIEQKIMSRDQLIKVIDKYELFAGSGMSLSAKVATLRNGAQIEALIDPANRWRANVQPSGLIITVRLGNPVQAADVANEFLAKVLDEGRMRRSGRAERTLDFFVAEEARVIDEIATLERTIAGFKEQNAGSLPSGIKAQSDQLALLKEAQLAQEQRLIELETNSDRLRSDELARQTELLRQQGALLSERIKVIEGYLKAAPQVERELSILTRSLEQLQEEFKVVTARRADAAMTQAIESRDQFERFEVLESALVPEYPISASRRKIAMAGAIASVMGAFGLAFLIEWMSPVIRTSAQLERALGLRPVVAIPKIERKSQRGRYLRVGLAIVLAVAAAVIVFSGRAVRSLVSLMRKPQLD